MRAWEPLKGETRGQGKAWRAFKTFRDLGPERTLKQAAMAFYDRTEEELKGHEYDQVRRWSSRFDWMERAQAYDSWLEMHRRDAVEEHLRSKAEDFGRREAALQEKALEIRELAMRQSATILEWPLSEQRVVSEGEDGEEVTYVFMPSRWSKATAIGLYHLAVGDGRLEPEEPEADFDFSGLSDDEVREYVRLSGLLGLVPPRPEQP